MSDEKLSFETPANDAVVARARQKLCAGGCLKTWDEAGGGWMEFATGSTLAPYWHCTDCDAKRPKHDGTIANPPDGPHDPQRAAEAAATLQRNSENAETGTLPSEKSHSSDGWHPPRERA